MPSGEYDESRPRAGVEGAETLLGSDCKREEALEQENSSVQRQLSPQLQNGDLQTGHGRRVFGAAEWLIGWSVFEYANLQLFVCGCYGMVLGSDESSDTVRYHRNVRALVIFQDRAQERNFEVRSATQ